MGTPRARGQKSDKIDAYARAEELRRGTLGARVFKAPSSFALLRELAKSHLQVGRDLVRIQARLKSVYRSRGVPTPGASVYGTREREAWLERLPLPSRRRAQSLLAQLDFLVEHKQRAAAELIEELGRHPIAKVLHSCPGLGPIRVARLLSIVVTPHRFRTRQQFWSYCGLGIVMRSSSDWVRAPDGHWLRATVAQTRGLSRQHNHLLKELFKGAATTVITQAAEAPLYADYCRMLESGTKPNLAKLTLARKIAATVLRMWKDEEVYSAKIARANTTRARVS